MTIPLSDALDRLCTPAAGQSRSWTTSRIKLLDMRPVDYSLLIIYFTFVLGIGWLVRRSVRSSYDFLLSGRSLPAWIAGLAFTSANLGGARAVLRSAVRHCSAVHALRSDRDRHRPLRLR